MATREDYDKLYAQLLSQSGREELGDDPMRQEKMVEKIQRFLDTYPDTIPTDKRPDAPYFKLSIQEVYRRSLQTAIDIIRDVSGILTQRESMSNASFRRRVFEVFTQPERAFYVGIWLIFLSFVLYFIDSAA